MPSLFSRILAGELPGAFVFRETRWCAFLDIHPSAPGHTLLVPRHEAAFLSELPPEVLAELGGYLARLTVCVKSVTGAPAVLVQVNDGREAGQIIPHAHVHVVPRFGGDRPAHHQAAKATSEDLAAMAQRLAATWSGG
ncbi:HIT family protein [Planctomycetota bacterium]|nr:HIT family protein [Planctomycetota bacterium]